MVSVSGYKMKQNTTRPDTHLWIFLDLYPKELKAGTPICRTVPFTIPKGPLRADRHIHGPTTQWSISFKDGGDPNTSIQDTYWISPR